MMTTSGFTVSKWRNPEYLDVVSGDNKIHDTDEEKVAADDSNNSNTQEPAYYEVARNILRHRCTKFDATLYATGTYNMNNDIIVPFPVDQFLLKCHDCVGFYDEEAERQLHEFAYIWDSTEAHSVCVGYVEHSRYQKIVDDEEKKRDATATVLSGATAAPSATTLV